MRKLFALKKRVQFIVRTPNKKNPTGRRPHGYAGKTVLNVMWKVGNSTRYGKMKTLYMVSIIEKTKMKI